MPVWFKSRLNPWYIWIPSNPNPYSTKIIMKMRWQTIASNVSIRTISGRSRQPKKKRFGWLTKSLPAMTNTALVIVLVLSYHFRSFDTPGLLNHTLKPLSIRLSPRLSFDLSGRPRIEKWGSWARFNTKTFFRDSDSNRMTVKVATTYWDIYRETYQ